MEITQRVFITSYEHKIEMNLKISEIFESIQGEGPNAEKPSIFIRTANCNLSCSWCDTKYTWDWKNYDYAKEVHEIEINEIINKITKYNAKNLVITGGEPLLQQEILSELLQSIKLQDYFVEMETNCTIKPIQKIIPLVDQWNVSPKLRNSGNELSRYEISECYNFFAMQTNAFFKFVINDERDLPEVEHFIQKYNLPRSRILLMPQATNKTEYILRKDVIHSLSRNHNLRFSPRIQVETWGNQRGI